MNKNKTTAEVANKVRLDLRLEKALTEAVNVRAFDFTHPDRFNYVIKKGEWAPTHKKNLTKVKYEKQ